MNLLLTIQSDETVREVRLEPATKTAVDYSIDELAKGFLDADVERLDYSPGFSPEQDGVCVLKYELPDFLSRCSATLPNILPVDKKSLSSDPPTSKRLYCLDQTRKEAPRVALLFG